MPESRARDLATSLGQAVELNNITSAGGLASSGTGLVTYTNVSNLPGNYDSDNAGSLAFVTDSDKLYIHTGQGWFNIAIINTNPIWVTQPNASYELNTDATAYLNGTATTITLVARDSEGQEIQWSTETDAGFDNMAYISQSTPNTDLYNDSAVFTIEPMSEDSATATSGSVTFKASDGVNIITASASFTLEFATAVNNSAETTILLKASGNDGKNTTINDAAGSNPIDITTGSPVAQSFTPYHPGGYSAHFDGSADYLQVASSSDFAFGSNDFTIEFWAYPEAITTAAILDPRTVDSQAVPWIGLRNTGYWYYYVSGQNRIVGTAGSVTTNNWYHVAICRSSGTTKMFINGHQDGSDYTDNTSYVQGGVWRTGTRYNGTTLPYNGYIRDFRCINGTALYTTNFTPPTQPLTAVTNTKLLHSHLPYFADGSASAHEITLANDVHTQRFGPYDYSKYNVSNHGASVYFDASSKLKTTTYTGPIGTGDYTVECWVYLSARSGSGARYVFALQDGHSTSSGHGIQVYHRNSGSSYAWAHFTNNNQNNTSTVSKLKIWTHLAVARESGTTRFFVNGELTDTRTSDNYDATAYDDITVGGSGYGNSFLGYISDFRIINGTALYTATFTPPTEPLTAVTNTKYLTCNDTANIFNAAGTSNQITLTNQVESDTDVKRYASSSMLFDGTTDMVQISDDTNLDFGSEDFTIEGFYKMASSSSYASDHYLLSSSGGSFNAGPSHFGINIYQGNWRVGGFNDKLIGGVGSGVNTGIDTNWHHFAWTQGQRNITFYIDGVQTGSTVDCSSDTFDCGGSFKIGSFHNGNQSNWDGNLEDIRITKGLVRYPFTLPNQTVSNTTETKLIACHDSTVTTDGTGTHTITAYGNAASSTFGPHSGMKSTYFDGNGDYLEVDNSTEFQHSTNDLSIDFWMYYTGGSSTRNIVDNRGNNVGYAFQLLSGNTVGIYSESASGYVHTSKALDERKWYHIVYSRVSGTSYMFVNGALSGAGVTDTNNYTSQSIVIGARHSKDQQYYTGYVSNFRVVQGASLFPNSFTAPTSELTA